MGSASKLDWSEFAESGNWNVAKSFSELKIMKHLHEFDILQLIAEYGTYEILEEFILDDQTKIKARVNALRRMTSTIALTLANTTFLLKDPKHKALFESMLIHTKKLKRDYLFKRNFLYTEVKNLNKSSYMKINDDNFNHVLDILEDMKKSMLEPMNKAELIMKAFEDVDPDEIKRKITQDLIHAG